MSSEGKGTLAPTPGAEASTSGEPQDASGEGSCTLYIGNLHPLCLSKNLEEACRLFGDVEETKIVKDKATGQGAGFGFVRFATRKAAVDALKALNGKAYLGQALRVHWAFQSPHGREDTSHHFHVFVGDLGQEVTDGMLYSTACTIGDCSDARVMWDHATGRSKGYGFISFRNKEDAEAAVQKLNGQVIGSRRVRCGWAQHKQDDGPPPDYSTVDKQDPFNTNVYVGNTPPGWTEQELLQHFSGFGEITEVKLHKKGAYGFVRYAQHADAVKAIVGTHSSVVEGRALKCSWGKASASPAATYPANPGLHVMMPGLQPMGLGTGLLHPSLFASPLVLSSPGSTQQVLQGVPPGLQGMAGMPLTLAGQMQQMQLVGQQPASPSTLAPALGPGTQLFLGRGQALSSFPLDPTTQLPATYYGAYYQ